MGDTVIRIIYLTPQLPSGRAIGFANQTILEADPAVWEEIQNSDERGTAVVISLVTVNSTASIVSSHPLLIPSDGRLVLPVTASFHR